MKKSVPFTLTALLALQTVPSFADSAFDVETHQRPAKWWANITVGQGVKTASHTQSHRGTGAVLSFNGAFSDKVFGSLYNHHVGRYENDDMSDRGAMIGYRYGLKKGYYAVSSGLAYYHKKEPKSNYEHYKSEGVGVPLQLQAFWTPFKHVGFGLTSHAMVGKEKYASLSFGFQVYS